MSSCARFPSQITSSVADWSEASQVASIKNKFVTGDWGASASASASTATSSSSASTTPPTSTVSEALHNAIAAMGEDMSDQDDDDEAMGQDDNDENGTGLHKLDASDITVDDTAGGDDGATDEQRRAAKAKLKEQFDADYDTRGKRGPKEDDKEGDFLDQLKAQAEQRARLNQV